MPEIDEAIVRESLRSIQLPEELRGLIQKDDLLSANLIQGLAVRQGRVSCVLEVPSGFTQSNAHEIMSKLRNDVEQQITSLVDVKSVIVVLTSQKKPLQQTAPPKKASNNIKPLENNGAGLGNVKAIIAVASGKGGVGKSTVTSNLAIALSQLGQTIGILDADIYGPSQPRLLGLKGKPQSTGKMIEPMIAYNIKVMSMGFLVDEATPTIWRGPMVQSALTQMLTLVNWGDLDILLVDMPPGTGDAQLTMSQQVPLAGAVIVSTPQDIALIDARKGLAMFERVNVPTLGLIENMSYFLCPKCGERTEVFSHGGARAEAEKLQINFLGEIPLDRVICETSDGGTPIVAQDLDSIHSQSFLKIAQTVLEQLALKKDAQKAPVIKMS